MSSGRRGHRRPPRPPGTPHSEGGGAGTRAVAEELKRGGAVTSLDLRGNGIHPDGVASLADALRANCSSLRSLCLEWNSAGIAAHGLHALADALALNGTLTALDLRNNRIGPDSATAIARIVSANRSITRLDLSWNEIGPAGGRALLRALHANRALTALTVRGNSFDDETVQGIGARRAAWAGVEVATGGGMAHPVPAQRRSYRETRAPAVRSPARAGMRSGPRSGNGPSGCVRRRCPLCFLPSFSLLCSAHTRRSLIWRRRRRRRLQWRPRRRGRGCSGS